MAVRRAIVVLALLLIAATLTAQAPQSGIVRSVSARWETNAYGDQLIVSDVDIETAQGVIRTTVTGGTIGPLTLQASDESDVRPGSRVRVTGGGKVESIDEGATIPINPTWPASAMPVPYHVNTASSQRLTPSHILAVAQTAFENWYLPTGADVSVAYAGPTSVASFTNNRHNAVFFRVDFDTRFIGRTLSWWKNGQRIDSDVMFNERYRYIQGDTRCKKGLWLEDVAAHEFGHFFGLGHSSIKAATMYPTTSYCLPNWRTLDADDIDGIRTAYP